LTTSRGDEAAQEIRPAQLELVRWQVEKQSAHEVPALSDGLMVAADYKPLIVPSSR
jgi:hypothetical protein